MSQILEPGLTVPIIGFDLALGPREIFNLNELFHFSSERPADPPHSSPTDPFTSPSRPSISSRTFNPSPTSNYAGKLLDINSTCYMTSI